MTAMPQPWQGPGPRLLTTDLHIHPMSSGASKEGEWRLLCDQATSDCYAWAGDTGLPRGPEAETQHLLSDGRENGRLLNSMTPCNRLTFSGCQGLSKHTFSNWPFFPVTKQFCWALIYPVPVSHSKTCPKEARSFLKKLGIKLPWDLTIPVLGIYPEKTIIEKSKFTSVFIATMFTIAKDIKATQRSISKWMDKEAVVYIYNGILHSHTRTTFESVLMRWMKVEPITQSEVSQKEKNKYHILTHIYGI